MFSLTFDLEFPPSIYPFIVAVMHIIAYMVKEVFI